MKTVGVAELKSKLSEYLDRVRRGHPVTVLDRRTPIALIVPYEEAAASLSVRRPPPRAPKLREIALPPPLKVRVDVVKLLRKERQNER
jgi:prevent-host-death family protein